MADGVNRLRSPERAMIVITHYQRLLDYIVPDVVHVLSRGRIVKTGGKELALELEAKGYAQYQDEAALRVMNAEVRAMKTAAEQALAERFAAAKADAAGRRQGRGAARGGVRPLRRARACRTGASRSGNTPICAR